MANISILFLPVTRISFGELQAVEVVHAFENCTFINKIHQFYLDHNSSKIFDTQGASIGGKILNYCNFL